MLNTQPKYKFDLEQIKNTLDSKVLWYEVLKDYPQISDALNKPGQHFACQFHDGVDGDGFRFFDDAFLASRKTKGIAICNSCGTYTPLNLLLKLEGKDKPDAELIERLAIVAGMPASNEPVKPAKEKAAAGGGSRYPAFALSQSTPVDGASLKYLQSRGLSDIAENLPDAIRCLKESEYKTKGETVYKGECLIGRCTYPDGTLAGIIRIFLSADGGKAVITDSKGKKVDPKPMAGQANNGRKNPLNGSAVRMPGTGQIEHAGEGIETILPVKLVLPETANACGTADILKNFDPMPETTGVLIWADKDKSKTGEKKAEMLVAKLRKKGIPAVVVLPEPEIPDGKKGIDWLDVFNLKDGADSIKRAYIKGTDALAVLAEKMETAKKKSKEKKPSDQPKRSDQQSLNQPYQPLGFDRENIYIMTKVNRQVRTISYKSLKALVLSIASYEYWSCQHPKIDRNGEITGFNHDLCVDQLIQQTNAAGVYDPNIIRGRGFAVDNGRLVRHLGDRLVVDGETVDLFSFDSEYTYEQTTRFSVGDYPVLTKEEALQIETACLLPFWKKPSDPFLFLGWCVLAPFCGALKWRPHLWITAPAGTGKSTWLVPIVDFLVGRPNLAKFDNVSTEAGIRQTLKHDAKPTLLEEAEAETPEDRRRVQRIVQYARNCSTDNDIQTAKGTPTGSALSFSGRSMFSYISTKDALTFSADKSRTACIELYKIEDTDRVDEHAKKLTELISVFDKQCFSERLIAFVSANWKMLQHNISVFSLEAGRQLKSSRHGDQYGTLLAGYWTVTKQSEITEDEARTLICSLDLNSMTEDQDEQTDEQRCLDLIMAIDIRVDIHKPLTLTIGEAVNALAGDDDDQLKAVAVGFNFDGDPNQMGGYTVARDIAQIEEGRSVLKRVLRRFGIIYQADNEQLHGCKGQGIYIANTCEYLKTRMDKTPFVNWSKILKRLDRSHALPKEKYLKINNRSSKAVFIEV